MQVVLGRMNCTAYEGHIYAIKVMNKVEVAAQGQVERTQTERTILANVRHPFIVRLHYTFQSPQQLYMVMEFVQVRQPCWQSCALLCMCQCSAHVIHC
jgi:serine/threonine protein kinase